MPRTSAAQRREEILTAASRLFATKGVAATTMNDILSEVGIAKGTLYYHFTSKDEILRALIERTVSDIAARAAQAAALPAPAVQRFLAVVACAKVEGDAAEMISDLHDAANTQFHLMSVIETIRALTPVLAGVVDDGAREGVFTCDDPSTTMEIILTSAFILTDDGFFEGGTNQVARRTLGVWGAAETLLGAAPGTLTDPALGGQR